MNRTSLDRDGQDTQADAGPSLPARASEAPLRELSPDKLAPVSGGGKRLSDVAPVLLGLSAPNGAEVQ